MRTPVKICGITRLEDAQAAAQAGAWAVGFVFYPQSPRRADPAQVARIVRALPPELLKVGVVVDFSAAEIAGLAQATGLRAFQLHGSEPPELARELARQFTIIKAFRPRHLNDLDAVSRYAGVGRFLIDAFVDGVPGGTGRRADPRWIAPLKRFGEIGLAGGITPENARAIAEQSQADFLDLSSGVEESPGIKSATKLRKLFAELGAESGGTER